MYPWNMELKGQEKMERLCVSEGFGTGAGAFLKHLNMEPEKGPVEKGMHLQMVQVAVSDHFFGRYSY